MPQIREPIDKREKSMKLKNICILLCCLFLVQAVFCQEGNDADPAKTLAEKIKTHGNQSILDAGRTGDRKFVPYLKTLKGTRAQWAQMALAKLGEVNYLNQILEEVDSPNPEIQDRAMAKLVYVGGKTALRKLVQLLDDTSPRESPECKVDAGLTKTQADKTLCGLCCDVIFYSRSSTAILSLSRMVENPPTKIGKPGNQEDIEKWKAWLRVNRNLIE